MTIEYRCSCNRCGSAWCINDGDIKTNKLMKTGAKLNMLNAALQATDSTAASIYGTMNAERYESSVTDFARCPNCGSIRIEVDRWEL